jgi:hypothetical protein
MGAKRSALANNSRRRLGFAIVFLPWPGDRFAAAPRFLFGDRTREER